MYDVIVIGAGPSGMMASVIASQKGLKVLLIDKNAEVGRKLKLTGGGRCNLTNLKKTNELVNVIHQGKTLYSALTSFSSEDIYNFFSDAGVELQVEDNDRVFTKRGNALELIQVLKNMLSDVTIMYNTTVTDINYGSNKEVITTDGTYKTRNIVIATGGKSYPQTGSTGDGYKFAKKAGHTIEKLYPAETYIVTKDKFDLAGLTINVSVKYENKTSTGSMLFTHVGLTGPAIFNLSEFINKDLLTNKEVKIHIDYLPKFSIEALTNEIRDTDGSLEIRSWLKNFIPVKLAEYILGSLKSTKIASLSKANIDFIVSNIKNMPVSVIKTGTLEEAIVTSGGVCVKEINPKTMESKLEPGLFFAGEVLDIHGPMGGYNLTVAFTSGYAVGQSIT